MGQSVWAPLGLSARGCGGGDVAGVVGGIAAHSGKQRRMLAGQPRQSDNAEACLFGDPTVVARVVRSFRLGTEIKRQIQVGAW